MALPYEHPLWSTALGESLHPGGESLSRRLVELCSFRKGDHVLDAGCGPGVTLGILIEMGVDAVGLDTSCHFLEMAAERGPVVKGELLSLPFGDGSLDGAVAECVLFLQDDVTRVLRELSRVLKKDGLLAVTDLFGKEGGGSLKEGHGRVRRAPDLGEIEAIFHEGGFRVEIFEDHSCFLRECAAKLVWAGVMEGREVRCSTRGYGLWLAKNRNKFL